MKSLQELTNNIPPQGSVRPVTLSKEDIGIMPRREIITMFLDKLNSERIGTKYKPLTAKIVAIKLGHLKSIQDLHYFFNLCDRSKSFGSKFFYELKVQK